MALGNDLRAIALLNLGVTQAWSLRLAESEKSLSEGAALAHDIGRPYLEVACLAHLGFAATGRSFALARQHCENAIAQAALHGWDTEPVIAPALATLAGAARLGRASSTAAKNGWSAPGVPPRPARSQASACSST